MVIISSLIMAFLGLSLSSYLLRDNIWLLNAIGLSIYFSTIPVILLFPSTPYSDEPLHHTPYRDSNSTPHLRRPHFFPRPPAENHKSRHSDRLRSSQIQPSSRPRPLHQHTIHQSSLTPYINLLPPRPSGRHTSNLHTMGVYNLFLVSRRRIRPLFI